MKQTAEELRVQLDTRPMVPLAAFAGMEVRPAIALAATQITEQFGPQWTALVTTRADGHVSVLRISDDPAGERAARTSGAPASKRVYTGL